MIKELSLAILFGLLIGFGLTGTIYFVKQGQSNKTKQSLPKISAPTSAPENKNNDTQNNSPDNAQSFDLKIISPQNNDIIATSKTTLNGQTDADSLVVITTPIKNYHLDADSEGNFSLPIDLEVGYNVINITAINQNDQEAHMELFITYSTTKLE